VEAVNVQSRSFNFGNIRCLMSRGFPIIHRRQGGRRYCLLDAFRYSRNSDGILFRICGKNMLGKLVMPNWNYGVGIVIGTDWVDNLWEIYKIYDFTTMTYYWVDPEDIQIIE
jgi:hypothetical protein